MHGGASTVKVVMLMGPSCHGGWLCGGGRGGSERKLMKGGDLQRRLSGGNTYG